MKKGKIRKLIKYYRRINKRKRNIAKGGILGRLRFGKFIIVGLLKVSYRCSRCLYGFAVESATAVIGFKSVLTTARRNQV